MRRLILVALFILAVPLLVLMLQYRSTYQDTGSRANYLEVQEPPQIDLDDPRFQSGGVPILCYHYVKGAPGPGYLLKVLGAVLFNLPTLRDTEYWTTQAEVLDDHLAWLSEHGYTTIDLDTLGDMLEGKVEGPPKPIVITFDDADRSILERAAPILERYGMQATVLVVSAKVGQKWNGLESLRWDELKQMDRSGVFRIESHSHDMHYKVKTEDGHMVPVFVHHVPDEGSRSSRSTAFVIRDLHSTRQAIRTKIGRETRWLAWPYGWANTELDSLARVAGFRGTLSLSEGTNATGRDDTWHLSRITVTARTTLRSFVELMESVEADAPAIGAQARNAP